MILANMEYPKTLFKTITLVQILECLSNKYQMFSNNNRLINLNKLPLNTNNNRVFSVLIFHQSLKITILNKILLLLRVLTIEFN